MFSYAIISALEYIHFPSLSLPSNSVCVRCFLSCIYVTWIESTIFDLQTCIQTYLYLAQDSEMYHFHVAFYASGVNLQSFGLPRCQREEGKRPWATWNWSLSVFLSLFALFFFLLVCSSPCFLVLSSSPTLTFRNIREHHNNSYQVPVCSMIYSRILVSLTSVEVLLTACSDKERFPDAARSVTTGRKREMSCDCPQRKSGQE